jgi:hypothetical protein
MFFYLFIKKINLILKFYHQNNNVRQFLLNIIKLKMYNGCEVLSLNPRLIQNYNYLHYFQSVCNTIKLFRYLKTSIYIHP